MKPWEEAVIAAYVENGGNQSAAFRTGKPASKKWLDKTVNSRASEFFALGKVQGRLDEIAADAQTATGIDAQWVLTRLALLADFNIKKFTIVENGIAYYDFSNATDDDWYCISEYAVDQLSKGLGEEKIEVERVKLKNVDKLRALELVGKHRLVQAFEEKHVVETNHTFIDRAARSVDEIISEALKG